MISLLDSLKKKLTKIDQDDNKEIRNHESFYKYLVTHFNGSLENLLEYYVDLIIKLNHKIFCESGDDPLLILLDHTKACITKRYEVLTSIIYGDGMIYEIPLHNAIIGFINELIEYFNLFEFVIDDYFNLSSLEEFLNSLFGPDDGPYKNRYIP